eukprot:SAG11_NODE_20490_length_444_cov_0.849275_1_plen_31_part_01
MAANRHPWHAPMQCGLKEDQAISSIGDAWVD